MDIEKSVHGDNARYIKDEVGGTHLDYPALLKEGEDNAVRYIALWYTDKACGQTAKAIERIQKDIDRSYGNNENLLVKAKAYIGDHLRTVSQRLPMSLYVVDIPDYKNGKYLDWERTLSDTTRHDLFERIVHNPSYHSKVNNWVFNRVWQDSEEVTEVVIPAAQAGGYSDKPLWQMVSRYVRELSDEQKLQYLEPYAEDKIKTSSDMYKLLTSITSSQRDASLFLSEAGYTGMSVPVGMRHGRPQKERNFIIFSEKDLNIVNRIDFMRDNQEKVYGWTSGDKIFLTEDGLNPETPLHEYTHLWAKSMQTYNPEGWNSIKKLIHGTPIWKEVKNDKAYKEISDNEDEVTSEALARLSGRANASYLARIAETSPTPENVIQRIRTALDKFWHWVGESLFDIKSFGSIEEVTDRIMYDLSHATDLKQRQDRISLDVLSTSEYESARILAHGVKDGDMASIKAATQPMSAMLSLLGEPQSYVLVPIPGHEGKANYTLAMAKEISEATGIEVRDSLVADPHEKLYDIKKKEGIASLRPMDFRLTEELPDGKMPIFVDNVLDTGTTAMSALNAVGKPSMMIVVANTANAEKFPYPIHCITGIKSLEERLFTKEEMNIIAKAKADGTYLKAPTAKTRTSPRSSGHR